ncbi:hypothetical protein SAMN02745823_00463 [Sporobacter termitidis DSM 10068]|uniref:Uncharacterized protein n=1 Tax=Sporobacter termitidis DSM 10068 TaxID=1123282 RepID=A0A1M5UDE6_9FIRM|nr:hypothetical protein [Sporobacter termitidis]SHH60941.1 hypothetical protein SAMN02745823_00463 [Sporobacter termitidis DSM 10068]
MKLKYSFVCDSANISLQGNLNALGIFSNINAPKYPLTYSRFFYVANVVFHRSEAGPHKFRLSFVNDDGRDIVSPIEGALNATPQVLSNNLLLELNGITFPGPGVYQIDLSVDNVFMGSETITATVSERTLQQ